MIYYNSQGGDKMDFSVTNMVSSLTYTQTPKPTKKENQAAQTTPASAENKDTVYANDKEKKENETMLLKMQLSNTKLDALGEYFGSMQEALRDSGSDGIMAYRRTNNLISNATDYMETEEYESKENSKCLVKDITEKMDEGKEALDEKLEAKKEKEKEHSVSEETVEKEKTDVVNQPKTEYNKEEKTEALEMANKTLLTSEDYSGKTIDISL